MSTLTLSMIVKNEEKYLKDCLESVKNIVNDIVIVDTGSTDRTLEIARGYNAKIYHFDWINDFSAARNYALQYSPGEWILYLDADERLDPLSVKEVKRLINRSDKVGYFCTVKSVDNNKEHSIRYVRLFRNSKEIKFTGKVHEQIVPSLNENNYKLIHSSILINHVGYDITNTEKEKKANRNLEILLNEYNQNKSPYIAYKIGQTYFLLGNYEQSTNYINDAISSSSFSKELKADCYVYLSQIAFLREDYKSSLEFIDKAIELNPHQPFYYYYCSRIYHKQNDLYKAKLYTHKALEASRNVELYAIKNLQTIYVDVREIIYFGLSLSYQTNDHELIEYFIKELYKVIKEDTTLNRIQFIKLMETLMQGRDLTPEMSEALLKCVDNHNLYLFILGIKHV